MSEARNASSSITAQYFTFGQTISGTNYFYTRDYLGSAREFTDGSGNIQSQYSYDSYGRPSRIQGGLAADFQYAGYYSHLPSGLNITVRRDYSPSLARWVNRDPLGERAGTNLYRYVQNNPVGFVDPIGTNNVGILPWPGGSLPPGWNDPRLIVPGLIIDPELTIPLIFLGGGLVIWWWYNQSNSGSGDSGTGSKDKTIDCSPNPCNPKLTASFSQCQEYCDNNCLDVDKAGCYLKCRRRFGTFLTEPRGSLGGIRGE